jgi:hypothetical protein
MICGTAAIATAVMVSAALVCIKKPATKTPIRGNMYRNMKCVNIRRSFVAFLLYCSQAVAIVLEIMLRTLLANAMISK